MVFRPPPRLALPALALTLAFPLGATAQAPTAHHAGAADAAMAVAPLPPSARTDAGTDAPLSPADVARRAQVIAHVGDQAITVGEIEDMLNQAPAPVRQSYAVPARRHEFVDNLVQTTLLANEARRRGLDRQPDTSAAIRRILSQRLEQVAVIDAVNLNSITDDEVRAYYQSHLNDYQQPEFRRATAIIVDDRATAEQVATAARATRGDMRQLQALVRQRSTDPATRTRDGDLFYFKRDGSPAGTPQGTPIDPAIATAAFGLGHEMDVSAPVQTAAHKWAVVVLTGIRPALSRSLEDPGVANSIRGFILRQGRSDMQQQLLADLRTRLHPEVHEDRLDLIHLPQSDLGNVPPFQPGAPRPGGPAMPGMTPMRPGMGVPGRPGTGAPTPMPAQ